MRQSFNTTTSTGRLTLNVPLSFAQFEREVIGERIRDKFAALRRKGMWLGGPQRLPGALVEEAVIGEIRRMLRTPEVAARTVRAVRKDYPDLDEPTVVAALGRIDDLWKTLIPAEQARIVQLLVARITVSEAGLAFDLRHDGTRRRRHAQRSGRRRGPVRPLRQPPPVACLAGT